MSRHTQTHWASDNGGGRPISGRLQRERRGTGSATFPDAPLKTVTKPRREEENDDRRIRQLVRQRLAKLGPQVEDEVEVSVRNGRVVLSGLVESDYAREMILLEVERIAYVKDVRSSLRVGSEVEIDAVNGSEETEAAPRAQEVRTHFVVALVVASLTATVWMFWSVLQR